MGVNCDLIGVPMGPPLAIAFNGRKSDTTIKEQADHNNVLIAVTNDVRFDCITFFGTLKCFCNDFKFDTVEDSKVMAFFSI